MKKKLIKFIAITVGIALLQQGTCQAGLLRPIAVDERPMPAKSVHQTDTLQNSAYRGTDNLKKLLPLEQKRYEELTFSDLDAANEIASNAVFNLYVDTRYQDRVKGLQLEKWLGPSRILDAPEELIIAMAHLVLEAGGDLRDHFFRALKAAHAVINFKRQDMHSGSEKEDWCRRLLILSRALLLFYEDDPEIIGNLALDLIHLHKYEEAEGILVRLQGEGRGLRSNIVNLGYAQMEIARRLANTLLCPALEARRFEEALSIMERVKQLLSSAQRELLKVASPYLQGRSSNLTQVPRALSGLALVDSLYIKVYIDMAKTPRLQEPRDYALLSLGHLRSALEYSTRALGAKAAGEDVNPHSVKAVRGGVLNQAKTALEVLSGRGWHPLSFKEAGRRIDAVISSLNSIQGMGIEKVDVSGLLAIADEARQGIGLYEEAAGLFCEGVRSYAKAGSGAVDSVEDSNARIREAIMQGLGAKFPTEQVNRCIDSFFGVLQYDAADINIIYVYQDITPEERDAETIAGYVGLSPQEIERRLRQDIYRLLDFSLAAKIILAEPNGPPSGPPAEKRKPDTTTYDNRFLAQLAEGRDLSRLVPLEILYNKIQPWLTAQQQSELEASIQDIRRGIDSVVENSRLVLGLFPQSGQGGDAVNHAMSKRERRVAKRNAQPDPDKIALARRDIIFIRVGQDKKGGYRAGLDRLKGRLAAKQANIERQISRGAGVIAGYVAEVGALEQRFGINWLNFIKTDLARLREATIRLARSENAEGYLSNARFEELQLEAQALLDETEVITRNYDALDALKKGLSESNQMAERLRAIAAGEMIQKLGRDVNLRLEELEHRFQDIAFDRDFGAQRDALAKSIAEFQERLEVLTDLANRGVQLADREVRLAGLAAICGSSDPSLYERLSAVIEKGKAIVYPFFTYDEYEQYAGRLTENEKAIVQELDELEKIARAAHKEKRRQILEGIQHLGLILGEIEKWVNDRLSMDYHGPEEAVKEAHKYFNRFRDQINEASKLLLSEEINYEKKPGDYCRNSFSLAVHPRYFLSQILFTEIDHFVHSTAERLVELMYTDTDIKRDPVKIGLIIEYLDRHGGCRPYLDAYGYPEKVEFSYAHPDKGRVIEISTPDIDLPPTETFELFYDAESELDRYLKKWRDFNGRGPIPMPEILNAITYAFTFYLGEYIDTGPLPVLDSRTVLRACYRMAFADWSESVAFRVREAHITPQQTKNLLEYLGIGYRTPEMENYGWDFLDRFLGDIPIAPGPQGWTKARTDALNEFLDRFRDDLERAMAIKDADARGRKIAEIHVYTAFAFFPLLSLILRPDFEGIEPAPRAILESV